MQKIKLLYALFLITLPLGVWGQLTTYPLEQSTGSKTSRAENRSAKINADIPVSLPFWDDFSFAVPETHPVDSLWIDNARVLVSSGQAINAPTINVATFDGLDENGTPYSPSPTDILAFGYRDTLESQSIKMTEVAPVDRGSVYFSFKYQAGGNGEPPDPQDFLRLEFKKSDGEWQSIVTLTADDAPDLTIFYDKLIQITDNIFFHDEFRFRFVSFGRKSGRFDAWHIDYVYLNNGPLATNASFPDRSYYTKLSPMFNEYYAMPQSHFKTNVAGNLIFPFFGLNSLENENNAGNYSIDAEIISFEDSVMSQQVQTLPPTTFDGIGALERKLVTLKFKPDLSPLTSADSIFINYTMTLVTGDNDVGLDYGPIDFYANDTLRQSFTLKDYYAYDDGVAEYSAGLVDSRNEMAYRFIMKANSDTINGVFLNLPPFTGGTAASSIDFFILSDVDGKPGNLLYEESIPITQNSGSEFTEYPFAEGTIVKSTFYIGYREPITGSVRIGLDKSNDSGENMYYRLSETSQWQQNDRVTGSLMMRPRFGFGEIYSNVAEEQKPVSIYPNPSNGEFNVKGAFDQLRVISTTGQPINTTIENDGDNKRVQIVTSPGIYIIQYRSGAKIYTEKILITK